MGSASRVTEIECKWRRGLDLACVLQFAEGDSYKVTCAEFHHGHARHLCREGEVEGAKEAVAKAARPWPPIRSEMLEDEGLEGLW